MAIPTILTIMAVALVATAVKPKWGALIVWPILFLYPHGYWYHANLTPYRMGFDDIFIVYVFVVVIVRLRLNRGLPIKLGWAGRLFVLFSLILAVSTGFGVLRYGIPTGTSNLFIKTMFKAVAFICLFAMLANAVDTRRDWLRVVRTINMTMILAGLLVVVSYYSPAIARVFTSPARAARIGEGWVTERVTGAFAEPNTAGALLAASAVLLLYDMRVSRSVLWKGVLWFGLAVCAAGVLYTQSRTGLFALALIPGVMLFLHGSRKYAAVALALGILAVIALPQYWGPVLTRAAHSFDPQSQYGNIWGRVKHWVDYLGQYSVFDFFVPLGPTISRLEHGQKPHNGFVDLIAWFGIYGIAWFGFLLHGIGKRLSHLKYRSQSEWMYEFRRFVSVFLVVWLIPTMTMDVFSPGFLAIMFMFTVFWLLGEAAELTGLPLEYDWPAASFGWEPRPLEVVPEALAEEQSS
jgi:hypothetical protein